MKVIKIGAPHTSQEIDKVLLKTCSITIGFHQYTDEIIQFFGTKDIRTTKKIAAFLKTL